MMKLNDIYKRIGERIQARKHKNGEYVKADIAKKLNVTPQDISNWAFRNKFPWEELFTFSQEHKLSFDWLLTGKDQQNIFMRGWSTDAIKASLELKEILDYGEKDEKEDILSAIKRSQKFRDLKKPVAGASSGRRKKSIIK